MLCLCISTRHGHDPNWCRFPLGFLFNLQERQCQAFITVCVCAKDWQMLTALPNEQLMKVTFYRGTQNNEICSYRSKGVILSPLQCIIKLGLESKIKKNKQSKTQFKAVQKKPWLDIKSFFQKLMSIWAAQTWNVMANTKG